VRFTFSQYRDVARRGGTGWRPPSPGGRPSPVPSVRRRAIALYHRDGISAALGYLGGQRGSPGLTNMLRSRSAQQRAIAENARTGFDHYISMDMADGRPWSNVDVRAEVTLGENAVAVEIDVVVEDASGYSGRLLLWDQARMTLDRAELYAAPCFLGMDERLGTGIPSDEIEVWHLLSKEQLVISRRYALERLGDVRNYLKIAATNV
jgi:hypothetical protein